MNRGKDLFDTRILSNYLLPLGDSGGDNGLRIIARPYAKWVPVVAVIGFAASLMEGIGIGLLIPLLALLLANAAPQIPVAIPAPVQTLIGPLNQLDPGWMIAAIVTGILTLIILKGAIQAANDTFIAHIEGRIGADIRNALAARTVELEYPFFLTQQAGRLINIIATDSWLVADTVRWRLKITSAVTGLVVFGILLAWLELRLFAIVLVGALLIRAAVAIPKRRLKILSDEVSHANQFLASRMLAIVDAIRVIRIFGQASQEHSRFVSASAQVRRSMFASQRLSAMIGPASEVAATLIVIAVIYCAYRLGMTIPVATAFLILLSRALPQARMINEANLGIASVRGSVREVEWLLGQQPDKPARSGSAKPDMATINQPIRFENASYAYPDGTRAINGISVTIKPGTVTALMGPSGSGKTSFVNLICRLVAPSSGAIFHGDQPLDDFDAAHWRSHIAIAGQDVGLTGGTVAQNIAYGLPSASRQQIEDAAEAAGAAGFITTLAEGYDAQVGVGGRNLSGGQRQRIGLARALLRRPDLLILDEATSEVDAISEGNIMKLLADKGYFRTALVISHRASTLANCAAGIVFCDGAITEAGPLEQLAYFRAMSGDGR